MILEGLLQSKRLIVTCGSGGVGKTTTSAAIALYAASKGRKTLVLTIDPARRLAQSLGLGGLDNTERRVPESCFVSAGIEPRGELYAAMLDTKASLDHLIRKITKDRAHAERILANSIYRQMSNALAGSQEYAAMERLHEIMTERDYDLVVLDTPPTKNALDFLEAPNRLAAFLDENIVKWFIRKPGAGMGVFLVQKGGEVVFRLLKLVLGDKLISDLTDFFQAFSSLIDGFRERSRNVHRLLRDSRTAFVLVTSAEANAMSEALYFRDKLGGAGIPLEAVVVNRAFEQIPETPFDLSDLEAFFSDENVREALGRRSDMQNIPGRLGKKLIEIQRIARKLNQVAKANIERLAVQIGSEDKVALVPAFSAEIHDLAGLMRMNAFLFSS